MADCENAGYSNKTGRVYCRSFSYAEARERHAAGESLTALARDYGVTAKAVRRAVDPEFRQTHDARSSAHTREHYRAPCKGGCGRRVWTHGTRKHTGYCPTCCGAHRSFTVREDTLLCSRCGTWRPDRDFPKNVNAKARRGRHSICRSCQGAARKASREARRVPCVVCGGPCSHPNDTRSATGLCRPCYYLSRSTDAA